MRFRDDCYCRKPTFISWLKEATLCRWFGHAHSPNVIGCARCGLAIRYWG
jgi:hypothetical protein